MSIYSTCFSIGTPPAPAKAHSSDSGRPKRSNEPASSKYPTTDDQKEHDDHETWIVKLKPGVNPDVIASKYGIALGY